LVAESYPRAAKDLADIAEYIKSYGVKKRKGRETLQCFSDGKGFRPALRRKPIEVPPRTGSVFFGCQQLGLFQNRQQINFQGSLRISLAGII